MLQAFDRDETAAVSPNTAMETYVNASKEPAQSATVARRTARTRGCAVGTIYAVAAVKRRADECPAAGAWIVAIIESRALLLFGVAKACITAVEAVAPVLVTGLTR